MKFIKNQGDASKNGEAHPQIRSERGGEVGLEGVDGCESLNVHRRSRIISTL